MKHYIKQFFGIFSLTLAAGLLVLGVILGGTIFGWWGSADDIENILSLDQNSSIVYIDEDGKEVELQQLNSDENRVWVDIEDTPKYLQDAFVAIEDERFYQHNGFDLKRTTLATVTWIKNKVTGSTGATLGGSTITQQLIKNVTGEDDQTPARKVKEIATAIAVEKKIDKKQVLELYMNCIYLSQGCNGVQTASKVYFDKDASDLTLAESASIAGITQHPSLYDPLINPNKNKERQELVLSKMLELGYISQSQHDEAVAEKLVFTEQKSDEEAGKTVSTSYFVDQVIRDVLRDLMAIGYSEATANKILYSGGVKVYTTYDPKVQTVVENYYENENNFPKNGAQSAMVITDVRTGAVVGIAGGIGEKPGSLTWNRASMSKRQPGSTIKPIAVYAPALEYGLITPGSVFIDQATDYNGWTPRNYDHSYRGKVNVQRALTTSLNTIPVEILSDMGTEISFNFLKDKLGITTLVDKREGPDGLITDKGLAPLALGGLTDGATVMEMAAAFATFPNNGVYQNPYTYTEVKDRNGNVILTSDRSSTVAMKPSTAYLMNMMLNQVVSSGTGRGAGLSSGIFTAGKTGTTSDNNDRWFIGYTPYYSASVWYGYDTAKEITLGGNPCIPVFRTIMNKIHLNLDDDVKINKPSGITTISYCNYTGMRATSDCPSTSYYCAKDSVPKYCDGNHSGGSIYYEDDQEDEEEDEEEDSPSSSQSSGTDTSPSQSQQQQSVGILFE